MNNFEKIAATPEALGAFLASLPVATGPWDEEFQEEFCTCCRQAECELCPHQDERNDPTWWLRLGEGPGEVPGLSINIKAAFPVVWGKEYYTVAEKKKERRAPCTCCDDTGKVTIKGVEYACPKCKGDWRKKEVVAEETVYSVAKWILKKVEAKSPTDIALYFEQVNSKERYGNSLQVLAWELRDMVSGAYRSKPTKVYNDHKTAMDEVKRLNAVEREKQKGGEADA